jgi:hypothetical protein
LKPYVSAVLNALVPKLKALCDEAGGGSGSNGALSFTVRLAANK